jgi:hypothetical protein
MDAVIDWLLGRKRVVNQESKGIDLAIYLTDEFRDRTFTFKGLKNKYSGIGREEFVKLIRDELESMVVLYNYTTKAKTYTDRKGIPQLKIRLIGKVSMMHRYNPLDIKLSIATEICIQCASTWRVAMKRLTNSSYLVKLMIEYGEYRIYKILAKFGDPYGIIDERNFLAESV